MTRLGSTPLLETQGDIDHSTCRDLETAFAEAINTGARVVLLDLAQVPYVDSGGLSVLFSAARRLRQNGWLGVVGPNPNVRRLLELVGLSADPSFRTFDDRLGAGAALAEETGAR
ncbi:MAG: hypothetical protein A2133_02125 [Actinobacteria bacterium RBG_16_64_13]|nr:MAG: hypothetical protein A2133_02125 [Actinobacteria bacterium RBG_16_64_13]